MRGASTLRSLATSAAALMVSSALGSVIGLVFWTAAARLFPAATVGRAGAAVAAATLIGTFAQLNIGAVYVRFLTVSGHRAVRFVALGYVVTGTLAFTGALVFTWSGAAHSYLPDSAGSRLVFAGLTVVTMLLAVEDTVLTALRRATTVLVTNLTIAVSKLVLVLAFGMFAFRADLIVVWLAPMAAVVVVISWRLFREWLPQLAAEHPDEGLFPSPRTIFSFMGAEYLTRLLSMVPATVVPLIIVEVLGPGENAYFTVPWTINAAIGAAIWSAGGAFVAEGVAARGLPWTSLRLMFRIDAAIALVGVIGELLTADLLLGLLGPDYAAQGGALLRWLALAVPFQVLTGIFIVFVWLEGRVWYNVALLTVDNTLFLSMGFVLMQRSGLAGMGQAYLVGQILLAAGSAWPVWRRARAARRQGFHSVDAVGRRRPESEPAVAGAGAGASLRLADVDLEAGDEGRGR